MVFHWSQSDKNCPQVSRTLLNILADLNNAVLWNVSIRPFFTKSSSPFTYLLVTVQRAAIKIGLTVTFMFHRFLLFFFFNSQQGLGTYTSFRFPLIILCGQPGEPIQKLSRFFYILVHYYPVQSSGRD